MLAGRAYTSSVAPVRRRGKAGLASETWRRLFDFFITTRQQRDRALDRHGLTPNDSKALFSLDPRGGRTMRSLADEWACDASNATWVVDRLERRGLAERRNVPQDRRVKLVVLTPLGRRTRAELMRELYQPPPEILELAGGDLRALRDALARLPVGAGPMTGPPDPGRRAGHPQGARRGGRRASAPLDEHRLSVSSPAPRRKVAADRSPSETRRRRGRPRQRGPGPKTARTARPGRSAGAGPGAR